MVAILRALTSVARGSQDEYYDIDFWLDDKSGKVTVGEVRIHKVPQQEAGGGGCKYPVTISTVSTMRRSSSKQKNTLRIPWGDPYCDH